MSEPVFPGPLERPEFFRRSEPLAAKGARSLGACALVSAAVVTASLAGTLMPPPNGATAATSGAYVFPSDESADNRRTTVEPESPQDKLELAWSAYRRDLNKVLPGPHAREVKRFWADLAREKNVPVPQAGPTEERGFSMSWDDGNRHCEVEIYRDGRYEWFYCDRGRDEHDGAIGSREQVLAAVSRHLALLSFA